jgi:DNA repair protein RecN (Recombination protein N)
MLRHLAIRNFAIIEAIDIDVEPGFTVITGETGAGKSILVDALGLLLGDRADSGQIATDSDRAELEAVFSLDGNAPARDWLDDQALLDDDTLIVRRVISASGGSRAWINGRSATVGQLGELGDHLVEIHGQHEHQRLSRPERQRELLDRRVDRALRAAVSRAYEKWRAARDALEEFEREAGDPDQLELLRFQAGELDELALAAGEFAKLEEEQERLARADDIRLALATARQALDSEEGPSARDLLRQAIGAIEPVRELEPELGETAAMLEEAAVNIDEAIGGLERLASRELGDPERLSAVNHRLETALDLARKHRVQPSELPELTARLSERLERLENQGERRDELASAEAHARREWLAAADRLSEARRTAADALSEEVDARLAELGMDTARVSFEIESRPEPDPAEHGRDRVSIGFTANPGASPQPLARVASGGELSRVALALMIAEDRERAPVTRVFDEVDAGVGGETAHAVGRFLRAAAGAGQAMCVTHLAQVAACADHQISVIKERAGNTTALRVQTLDARARQSEIARMLGSTDSRRSLAHAKELLQNARAAG